MGREPTGPVNEAAIDWTEYDHGDRAFRRKRLGAAGGGEALGASLYEVPPGKQTWLRHFHTANEDAVRPRRDGDGRTRAGGRGARARTR